MERVDKRQNYSTRSTCSLCNNIQNLKVRNEKLYGMKFKRLILGHRQIWNDPIF
jgi:hypothetical protein